MRANTMMIGAAAMGAAMLASVPAAAITITQNYLVSAIFIQQAAPVKNLTLGFTLTFDPLQSVSNMPVSNYTTSSTAAQFNNLPILFSTQYFEGFGTYTTVGGGPFGSQYVEGTDDFFAEFLVDAQGRPTGTRGANVEYTFVGSRVTFNTLRDAVVSINPTIPGPDIDPIAGAVPEPATWAMLLLGFGAIGAVTRQRRRRAVFA